MCKRSVDKARLILKGDVTSSCAERPAYHSEDIPVMLCHWNVLEGPSRHSRKVASEQNPKNTKI